jgi:hypothetical protein
MGDIPRCETCRHFVVPAAKDTVWIAGVRVPSDGHFGTCARIKQGNETGADFLAASESQLAAAAGIRRELDVELDRLATAEKAAVKDGSGYLAALVVKPDFGCVLHEPK